MQNVEFAVLLPRSLLGACCDSGADEPNCDSPPEFPDCAAGRVGGLLTVVSVTEVVEGVVIVVSVFDGCG